MEFFGGSSLVTVFSECQTEERKIEREREKEWKRNEEIVSSSSARLFSKYLSVARNARFLAFLSIRLSRILSFTSHGIIGELLNKILLSTTLYINK